MTTKDSHPFGPRYQAMVGEVSLLVEDDGTGDLGVIVHHALAANPRATAQQIAAMFREAREEWAAERAADLD